MLDNETEIDVFMITSNFDFPLNHPKTIVPELPISSAGRQPLISVVTVVFNGAKTLRNTIESIVPQLGDDVEYIIIDGGSTDGTVDIVREHERHLAYWISERDSGIYDAWNKAIDVSRGKFISFVGADDVLEPFACATYIEKIKSHPEIEYWSSRVVFGGREGRVIGRPWRWHDFRRYMTVAHVGSLHRRDLFARYGKYNTTFRIAGDYEFLLRVGKNLKAGFADTVTARMGNGGISNTQAMLTLIETRSAKVSTKACNIPSANLDHAWAVAKLSARRLLSSYRK